jgi:hypothetical protein
MNSFFSSCSLRRRRWAIGSRAHLRLIPHPSRRIAVPIIRPPARRLGKSDHGGMEGRREPNACHP